MPDYGPRPACVTKARNCPACGSNIKATARVITDRYGWAWSLHACYQCGVEFQARPMTDQARVDLYASGRYRQVCEWATGKPWTDWAYLTTEQGRYGSMWSARVVPALPHGRWLDYGGSTGVVSAIWSQNGEATVTVADYGDGATTTPEQALAVPDGHYQAVILAQTLDHLPAPLQTLKDLARVTSPGGRLFVDVVQKAHTPYKIDHDTYYPRASIFLALVERSGWRPLWLDGQTHPTHWAVLAEKPV